MKMKKSTILVPAIIALAAISTTVFSNGRTDIAPNDNQERTYENRQANFGNGFKRGGKHHKGRKQGGYPDPIMVKVRVGVTDSQLPLWEAWKDSIDAEKENRYVRREEMREKFSQIKEGAEKPSAVEISERRISHMESKLEDMKKIHEAFVGFYNSLAEEQKAELDKCIKDKRQGKKQKKGYGKGKGKGNSDYGMGYGRGNRAGGI